MKFALAVLLFGVVCHSAHGLYIENEGHRFGGEVEVLGPRERFENTEIIEQFPSRHCGCLKEKIVNRSPEVVYHQPPTLVYKKQPTYIKINHSPVYVKSSPVVYQRDGDQIRQPLVQKLLPRHVHHQTNHVKVIRPVEEKVFLKAHEAPRHLEFAEREIVKKEFIQEEQFPRERETILEERSYD